MRASHLALALTLIAGPAFAQSYYCDRPRKPDIPSGYSADYDEMERAQDDVKGYMDDMQDYLDCLNSESDDAAFEARRVSRDWESEVSTFNNR